MHLITAEQEHTFLRRTHNSLASHRRRARQRRLGLPYGPDELRDFIRSASHCPYCGAFLNAHNFSCDHDVPLSRGGCFSFANLVFCCNGCNQVKGNLTGGEMGALLETLSSFGPEARAGVLARLRAGGKTFRR